MAPRLLPWHCIVFGVAILRGKDQAVAVQTYPTVVVAPFGVEASTAMASMEAASTESCTSAEGAA